MARIRTIKPEFWESEKVGHLSPIARLLFIGLISLADDDGRGRGEHRFLKSRLLPYDHQNTTRRLGAYLQEISSVGLAHFYEGADGCAYYWIPGFRDNQKIDRPRNSKLPPPPDSTKDRRKVTVGSGIKDQGSRKGKEREESVNPKDPSHQIATVYAKVNRYRPLTPFPSARKEFGAALDRGLNQKTLLEAAAKAKGVRAWEVVKQVMQIDVGNGRNFSKEAVDKFLKGGGGKVRA